MNETFLSTLTGVEKCLYKSAYQFHMDYHSGATEESAHQEGLGEIERIKNLMKQASKPQKMIDLRTGKTFYSTNHF